MMITNKNLKYNIQACSCAQERIIGYYSPIPHLLNIFLLNHKKANMIIVEYNSPVPITKIVLQLYKQLEAPKFCSLNFQ